MNRIQELLPTVSLLTFLLIASAVMAAEPDIQALIDTAPGADDYPLADQIILYENIEISVDETGRNTRRVHVIRKILTNWAMRRITDPRVGWDSSRQELNVAVCRTYQASGAIVETPTNGFNEVTPDAVGRCANFMGLREMVISHVGIEPGSVLELDYTVRDLAPALLPPSGQEFLQDRWPVLERTITLQREGNFPLVWEILHGEAEVQDRLQDEGTVTLTVRNIPGLADENNQARRGDYVPSLVYAFGIRGGWNDLAERLIAAGDEALQMNEAMTAWLNQVDEIEDHDLTPLDTVQRIAALIGSQTRSVHLPAGTWSQAPRPATEIFSAGCATPWEEAVLAVALLEASDLDVEFYLVSRYATWAKNVPAARIFNDVLIKTRLDDENWWLSPSRDKAWPGSCKHPDRLMLRVHGPKMTGVNEYRWPTESATGSSVMTVDLRPDDGDGFLAVIDFQATGLLRGKEMDAEALAKTLAGGVLPDAEVTKTEVLKLEHRSVHLRVEALVEDRNESLGKAQEGSLILDLPHPPHGAIASLSRSCRTQDPVRVTPLFLPGRLNEEITLRFTLPDNFALDYRPENREIQAGQASYRFVGNLTDQELEIHHSLHLPAGRIGPEDWSDFRRLLISVQSANAGRVILLEE